MASSDRRAILSGTYNEESQETVKSDLHLVFYRESLENRINIRCGPDHTRRMFSLPEDYNLPYHAYEIDFPTSVPQKVLNMRFRSIINRLMGGIEHIVYPFTVTGTTYSFFIVLPGDLSSSLEEFISNDQEATEALSVVYRACLKGLKNGELNHTARLCLRVKLCTHMMCICRFVVLENNPAWKSLHRKVKEVLKNDLRGANQYIREAQRTLIEVSESISTSDGRLEMGTNPSEHFPPSSDTRIRLRSSDTDGEESRDAARLVRPREVDSGDVSAHVNYFDDTPDSVLPRPRLGQSTTDFNLGSFGLLDDEGLQAFISNDVPFDEADLIMLEHNAINNSEKPSQQS